MFLTNMFHSEYVYFVNREAKNEIYTSEIKSLIKTHVHFCIIIYTILPTIIIQ